MIQAKCIQKFRDNSNKIYGYRLQDINGQTQDVKAEELKSAIRNKQIHIVNLTLTSDNRLVDKEPEKQLQNKKILPSEISTKSIKVDKITSLIEHICNELGLAFNLVELDIEDGEYSFKSKFKTVISGNTEVWISANKLYLDVSLYTEYVAIEDNTPLTKEGINKIISRIKKELNILNTNASTYINNVENIIKLANHHDALSNEPYMYISTMINKYSNRLNIYDKVLEYMHTKRVELAQNEKLCSSINKSLPIINKELDKCRFYRVTLDDILTYMVIKGTEDISKATEDAVGVYMVINENRLKF